MKNANPVSRFMGSLALALAAGIFAGCGDGKPVAAVAATPKPVTEFFPIKVGDKTVRMQLAVLPPEQERGLMGRRDLGPDDGMIFIFLQARQMSFWMKNTPTPLDIAYFTPEAELAEVWPAYPFDEKPIPSRSQRIKFVLEMNQGWFRKNGVSAGAKFDAKAVAAALKARGFDPQKFGL